MSEYTENLNLFKIIPSEDAKKPFNFYEILNENWDKLDSFSTELNNRITTRINSIEQELEETIEEIQTTTNTKLNNMQRVIDSLSFAPDYSKGVAFNGSYTAIDDGWVFAWGDGHDWQRWIYCNDKPVITWCGPSMGYAQRTGATFMVSKDDRITGTISSGYFYPMKEKNVL